MRTPLIISAVFHCTIFAVAMIDMPFLRNTEDRPMTIIPVEMVKITDVTNVREMVKQPEPQRDKPEPPKKQPERRAELPPPPPKMASTMPLLEKPEEKPKAKPKPPVQRAATPNVTPKSKPKPPSRFSADRIAALLNKVEDTPKASEKLAEKYAQQPQLSALDLRMQTISIADAVRKRIYDNGCWNVVAGSLDASNLKVTVSMHLTPNGTLARPPEVLNSARDNGVSEGAFRTAAESALRAVRKCVPYDMLPKDKYDLWQEMQINFDPKDMLTG